MSGTGAHIGGSVAAGFEPVLEAFRLSADGDAGTGAALSIRHRGEVVVDLWTGVADSRTGREWTGDTPSVIFSCTKGVMSILLARLVQEGRLDYEAPVADYWPEYAVAGKSATQVKHAISHRAGLSAPRVDWSREDILDWSRAVALLEAQEPLWHPGAAWSYHAITHGWLTGELVRRVTGLLPGEYLRQLVTTPLAVDAWVGLPEERHADVAHLVVGPTLRDLTARQADEARHLDVDWLGRAMTLGGALPPELVGDDDGFNRADVQAAQIPGAGGIASARALATIWSATVHATNGQRLLDDATLELATREQSAGPPHFTAPGPWPRWGMGFQLDSAARRYLGAESFGHDGAGGQVAFADRRHEIGFAFLTNRMEADDPRGTAIVDALGQVLDDAGR
ncbi:serine hydrolase domain-containing protein [Herbiconiux sp.]|uniref:serine hydrolase domain-containing protein n=1 Tax=Herbiconiux sp. TaxID=1871186 RepID=UPI0025BADB5C|nr:serine hydrolase domain-containing protein [Herbiconiux sp.]